MVYSVLTVFDKKILERRLHESERFLKILRSKALDLSVAPEFSKVVFLATTDFNLRASDIAEEFGVYRSTIKRWIDGTSVPPRIKHREEIADWIAGALEKDIEAISTKLVNLQEIPADYQEAALG